MAQMKTALVHLLFSARTSLKNKLSVMATIIVTVNLLYDSKQSRKCECHSRTAFTHPTVNFGGKSMA